MRENNEDKYRRIVRESFENYQFVEYIKSGTIKENNVIKGTHISLKCNNCKSVFTIRTSHFNKGNFTCPKCCGSYEKSFAYHIEQELKLNINDVWDFEKNTVNPYHISRNYTKNKVWIKCQKKEYHGSYNINCSKFILGRRCGYCNIRSRRKPHPRDSFAQYHIDNTDPNFLDKYWGSKNIVSGYELSPRSTKKIWIKCQRKKYHGEYEISCCNFTKGNRCSFCTPRKQGNIHIEDSFGKIYPNMAEYWENSNSISKFKVTKGSEYKAIFKCKECGESFKKPIYLVNKDSKPICPKCNTSQGERKIRDILDIHNIPYIHDEPYFKDLTGLGGGILRPDFILPDYKVWIEYDGEFHYKDITGNLKTQQYHDKLKDKYAKKNGWKLIRIPYWEFDNIENILLKLQVNIKRHKN